MLISIDKITKIDPKWPGTAHGVSAAMWVSLLKIAMWVNTYYVSFIG